MTEPPESESDPVGFAGIDDSAAPPGSSDGLGELGNVMPAHRDSRPNIPPDKLVFWGVLLEAALVVTSLIVAGLFDFYDHAQPLGQIVTAGWPTSILAGALVALVMFAMLVVLRKVQHFWSEALRRIIDDLVVPLFAPLTLIQIAVISIAAGLGEEMFFRWCLQGGLDKWFWFHPLSSITIASVIFGLCHWVNGTYALMATLLGAMLGLTMMWYGLAAAVVGHALYDFLAIVYLTRFRASDPTADATAP